MISRLRLASRLALLGGTVALTGVSARADTPFTLTATTTAGQPPITVSIGGSNLLNLVDSFINDQTSFQSQFQQLSGRAVSANLTFLGVPNAITFSTNAANTNVSVGFTPINVAKTFVGPTSQDVQSQIDNYFQTNGVQTLTAFLAAIARSSAVAVTDGNPNATTAIDAASLFTNQAFTPATDLGSQLDSSGSAGASSGGSPGKPQFNALGINSGTFTAGSFSGNFEEASYSHLFFHVIDVSGYANYLTMDGAKVYGAGTDFAVPIHLATMGPDSNYNWRLTPVAGISGRASVDLASGALLWDVGLVNTIDYRVNRQLILCLMNEFTDYQSFSISYGGYTFDPHVKQQIVKDGVRAVTPLTRRLVADAFVVETNFLQAAAIRQFTTIGGSLSLRAAKAWNLTLGVNYDTGPSYQSYSVGLASAWHW